MLDVIYKAAANKALPAGKSIARVMLEEFGRRRAGAKRSDTRLAELLEKPILYLLRKGASGKGGDPKVVARELVRAAKVRALATAASVNDTSATMISNETDPYTTARTVSIGITEANWAIHEGEGIAFKASGKKTWTWQCTGKCCKNCRSLAGKKVVIGKDFVAANGTRVQHPPLHPNCNCVVK